MSQLSRILRRLRALLRPPPVSVSEMDASSLWSCAHDLDELLAPGGKFPRMLWQPHPERIALAATLWRGPSHGLARPTPARLFERADYAPAHNHLVRFRDAAAFPKSGLVMPVAGQYWKHSSWPARWDDPRLEKIPGAQSHADGTTFEARNWRAAPRIKERVALITTNFSYMYGHWLCDTVAGVLWLLPAVRDGRVRLLARPLTDWQRAVLDHIGVPREAIIERDDPIVRCDDLIVPSLLGAADIGRPSPMLRGCFAALRTGGKADGPARVYIARDRLVRARSMVNEHEVISRLTELGFAILRPEQMSFSEQVHAFAQARIIVGAHGSGMANVGLAPPGCVVLEFLPELWI